MDAVFFHNKHAGKRAVVFGLGESVNDVKDLDFAEVITIGVNDIDAAFHPKYVLTLDMPKRFKPERLATMLSTRAEFFFSQCTEWEKEAAITKRFAKFKLGKRGHANIDVPGTIDYSNNSPYAAIILAHQMGCSEIAVIGVDFTDNHCHIADGTHSLVRAGLVPTIESEYSALRTALAARGTFVYNVSRRSSLKALPFADIEKFMAV